MLEFFDEHQDSAGKTVLVVDENPEWLAFLAQRCRSIGLIVQTASDAFAAVEIMDRKFPDLLILDIEMPAGNKKLFLECLGGDSESREIPAIALCSNADLNSVQKNESMVAYYVYKSRQNWNRIEVFISELIDVNPITSGSSLDRENPDKFNKGTTQ